VRRFAFCQPGSEPLMERASIAVGLRVVAVWSSGSGIKVLL
jgi:hypothetical protein